jgi:hypothetical protein
MKTSRLQTSLQAKQLSNENVQNEPKTWIQSIRDFFRSAHILAAKVVLERDKNITYNDNFLQLPTQADK